MPVCPDPPSRHLERTTQTQIFDGIREFAENWQSRALRGPPGRGRASGFRPDPDSLTHAPTALKSTSSTSTQLTRASSATCPIPWFSSVGYAAGSANTLPVEELDHQPLPRRCGAHDARWGQLDVVYAHWSGSIEPLSPSGYRFDPPTPVCIDRCLHLRRQKLLAAQPGARLLRMALRLQRVRRDPRAQEA